MQRCFFFTCGKYSSDCPIFQYESVDSEIPRSLKYLIILSFKSRLVFSGLTYLFSLTVPDQPQ